MHSHPVLHQLLSLQGAAIILTTIWPVTGAQHGAPADLTSTSSCSRWTGVAKGPDKCPQSLQLRLGGPVFKAVCKNC